MGFKQGRAVGGPGVEGRGRGHTVLLNSENLIKMSLCHKERIEMMDRPWSTQEWSGPVESYAKQITKHSLPGLIIVSTFSRLLLAAVLLSSRDLSSTACLLRPPHTHTVFVHIFSASKWLFFTMVLMLSLQLYVWPPGTCWDHSNRASVRWRWKTSSGTTNDLFLKCSLFWDPGSWSISRWAEQHCPAVQFSIVVNNSSPWPWEKKPTGCWWEPWYGANPIPWHTPRYGVCTLGSTYPSGWSLCVWVETFAIAWLKFNCVLSLKP